MKELKKMLDELDTAELDTLDTSALDNFSIDTAALEGIGDTAEPPAGEGEQQQIINNLKALNTAKLKEYEKFAKEQKRHKMRIEAIDRAEQIYLKALKENNRGEKNV